MSYRGDVSKKKDCLEANRTYLKYIKRESATLRDKPSWEDASKDREFYTILPGGRKILMSQEEAEKKIGPNKTFRIIISPEDDSIDLDQLVQKFMYSSFYGVNGLGERSTGFVACNHYNTSHPHAHILVSRKSEKQKHEDELRVSSVYVKELAHKEAGFICSCIGGPRTKREYMEGERKIIERKGLCNYDFIIRGYMQAVKSEDEEGKLETSHYLITDKELDRVDPRKRKAVRRRLNFLCQHFSEYVHRELNGDYVLKDGWMKHLETYEYLKIAGLEEKAKTEKVIIDNGPDKKNINSYSGIIKDVSVLDDYNEKVLLTIEDKEGQTHLLSRKISLDKLDKLKDNEINVKKTGRGMSASSRAFL